MYDAFVCNDNQFARIVHQVATTEYVITIREQFLDKGKMETLLAERNIDGDGQVFYPNDSFTYRPQHFPVNNLTLCNVGGIIVDNFESDCTFVPYFSVRGVGLNE